MEHGTFAVDHAARRVSGILIPWGERSRTSSSKTKPITFPRGAVSVPRDPSVVGLNVAHDRFSPIGRGAKFEDHDNGLYAEFDIADTDEGDAWLADRGEFVKLSAEVRNIERDENDHGTAELTGAALVSEGAFASAALFAIDGSDDDEQEEETPAEEEAEPPAAPAAEDTETDDESEEEQEEAVADFATVPGSLPQGRTEDKPKLTASGFVNALFGVRTGARPAALQPYMEHANKAGLFALADVTYDDENGLNAGGELGGPQFLGELWTATPDVRTFIPAVGAQSLTDMTVTGWRIAVGDDAIDEWAGNKTEIPSDTVTSAAVEFVAQRFAGGNDLAREYWDFNKTEIIAAYVREMIRLYMKKSDAYALAQTVAGANTGTLGTVPTGASAGLTAIIDLATAVLAAGGQPNLIRVSPTLHRELVLTLDGNQFAYLNAALGLESGNVGGLNFAPDARLAANQLLVADKNAIGVWELPGSPIRVDAQQLALGGYDKAFFGYIAAGVVDPSVVLKATITTP